MKTNTRFKTILAVAFMLGILFIAACDKTAPTSTTPPANESAKVKSQRADKKDGD